MNEETQPIGGSSREVYILFNAQVDEETIGDVIYMGGAKRISAKIARFMFHGVAYGAIDQEMDLKDIEERRESILNDQQRIADVVCKESKLTRTKLEDLFVRADFLDSKAAHESGIVHEVREIKLPKGAFILPLVFAQ